MKEGIYTIKLSIEQVGSFVSEAGGHLLALPFISYKINRMAEWAIQYIYIYIGVPIPMCSANVFPYSRDYGQFKKANI